MSDGASWISSRRVTELIRQERASWGQDIEHRIRPALMAGKIRSRAKIANLTSRAPHGGRRTDDAFDWDVKPDVWKGDGNNSRFSLFSDEYRSGAPGIGYSQVKLVGLSFVEHELLDFLDITISRAVDEGAGNDDGSKPRLSDAKLSAWWAGLDALGTRDSLNEADCIRHAQATFPDNHISRDRVRDLRGPQPRGPKPARQ